MQGIKGCLQHQSKCAVCRHKGEDFHTQWLIRPKVCQKQLVLKVQKLHGGVNNRGTGIILLLKNQRNTTKDHLASPFGSFVTQLQDRFSSDHQRVALVLSLVPKYFEGHSAVFRAHKGIGRNLQEKPTIITTKPWYGNVMLGSGTTTRVRYQTSQPILVFSVTASLSNIATLCWGLFAPFLFPAAPVSGASVASSGWKHIWGQQWAKHNWMDSHRCTLTMGWLSTMRQCCLLLQENTLVEWQH